MSTTVSVTETVTVSGADDAMITTTTTTTTTTAAAAAVPAATQPFCDRESQSHQEPGPAQEPNQEPEDPPHVVDSEEFPALLDQANLAVKDELLGEGQFGTVHIGTLRTDGKLRLVAVKKPKIDADQVPPPCRVIPLVPCCTPQPGCAAAPSFVRPRPHRTRSIDRTPTAPFPGQGDIQILNEAKIAFKLRNKNVAVTLGVTVGTPERWLVTQFYARGSLNTVLELDECSFAELRGCCQGVAGGAAYLADCKIVHRDLATRNVLVDELDGQIVPKISDFGLSRNMSMSNISGLLFYRPASGRSHIAIRWCSPEAISSQFFSEASDGGRGMAHGLDSGISTPPVPPAVGGGDHVCPVWSMRPSVRSPPAHTGRMHARRLSFPSIPHLSSIAVPCRRPPFLPPRALPPICRTSCSLGVCHRGP